MVRRVDDRHSRDELTDCTSAIELIGIDFEKTEVYGWRNITKLLTRIGFGFDRTPQCQPNLPNINLRPRQNLNAGKSRDPDFSVGDFLKLDYALKMLQDEGQSFTRPIQVS